jgi:hypothetical protein
MCIGSAIVILLFWATAWWSPWPFLLLNFFSIVMGKNAFIGWGDTIRRWLEPDCDPMFILATIVSIVVLTILFFASIYMLGELADSNGHAIRNVWPHVYFSTVTLTTLGYGNIVPSSTFTEVVAAVQSVIGFMGFAALTGIVVSIAHKKINQ